MQVRCEIVCIVYRYLQVLSCRRKVVSKAIKSTVLSDVKSSKSVCQVNQVSYRGVMYIYLSCTNVNISVFKYSKIKLLPQVHRRRRVSVDNTSIYLCSPIVFQLVFVWIISISLVNSVVVKI